MKSFRLKFSRNISTFIIKFFSIKGVWFLWQKFLSYGHRPLSGFVICPTVFNGRLLVNTSDYIGDMVFKEGLFDLTLIWFLSKYLHKGAIFCDVGANIGDTSCIAALFVGKKGYVYAFEPSTDNYKMLCTNIEINNLKNVYPLKMALGVEKGEAFIYIRNPSNRGMDSLVFKKGDESGEVVEINSIDFLIENNKMKIPNIIKIDVEGCEFAVLKGAVNLLSSNQQPILIFEAYHDGEKIFTFIKEVASNYRFYKYTNALKGSALKEIKSPKDMKAANVYCFPYSAS